MQSEKDEVLDAQVPKSDFPHPDWVRRLILEWSQACEVTVMWRTKDDLRGDTGEQGATIGSWLAMELWIREHYWNELNDKQRRFVLKQAKETKKLANVFFDAPLWQAAEFFGRFARALKKGCFGPGGLPKGGHGDDLTWEIKRVMMREWRPIGKLNSTSELCAFLLKQLPTDTAQGIKKSEMLREGFGVRVQKICQRCGLRFKGRGRPRKK